MKRAIQVALAAALILGATGARAESDVFLARDQTVPAETYLASDGAVEAARTSSSAWRTWLEDDEAPPIDRFELPGLWPIRRTAPELQTLVFGPTFRNQANRIEVGAGFGYVNSKYRFPFELSFEPTYRRNKHSNPGDRDFARFRTFGLAELWSRSSDWEATAVAFTGFYDSQTESFNTLEIGPSISQSFGQRFSISANLLWAGEWASGADFNNAFFGSVGASYNLGAGVRIGGFYEPDNNYTFDDDWGGSFSWQFLPFAELAVNAGKNDFVRVQVMFAYALERG